MWHLYRCRSGTVLGDVGLGSFRSIINNRIGRYVAAIALNVQAVGYYQRISSYGLVCIGVSGDKPSGNLLFKQR